MESSPHINLSQSFNVTSATQQNNFYLYTKESYWSLLVLSPTELCIILFGLIANTINLVVFHKSGVRDNVTTLLFFLSMSDTTFLCLATPNTVFWVIWVLTVNNQSYRGIDYQWPFDFRFLSGLFFWPAYTAFDVSSFISLSLGVMRCACVAMPLKFKLVFTKSRTLKWVVMLVVLAVALRIPVLSIHRVVVKLDPLTNQTYPYVSVVNNVYMNLINDIMNRGVITWISYSVMVGCVCLLTFKLSQASKIRQACTNQSASKSEQGMSAKDVQVVKSVVLVCSIFILSQFPWFVLSQLRLFNSDFQDDGKYTALYGIIGRISFIFSLLNASVNIFVYYNYNSKYKAAFRSLFHSSDQDKSQKN